MILNRLIRLNIKKNIVRHLSDAPSSSSISGSATNVNANVPGLSAAVIHAVKSSSVGPGVEPSKTGAYKAPEYFCYDKTSYYEAEVEMKQYRLKQPSALKK